MKKLTKLGLSAPGRRTQKNGNSTRSKEIDYSDIPELDKAQMRSMRRVGRPPFGDSAKLLIAIRVDPNLLEKIRKLAAKSKKGYQTLIHEILEVYVDKKAA